MTEQEAIVLLADVVLNDRRHRYYKRTTDLAKEYRSFITGVGVERYIPQFKRREDKVAYQQRKDITINITETICSNVIAPQYKLPRSNSIERTLKYLDNDNKKAKALDDIVDKFWDGKYSLDTYMGKSWVELNNIDPNAFIVIDWKYNEEGQRIRPYPVEYPSERVINYQKVHGDLKWIVVHRPSDEVDPEMYILYEKDYTIMFRRKEEKNHAYKDITFFQKFPIDNYKKAVAAIPDGGDAYFEVFAHHPHNLNMVPGCFVGFQTDQSTRRTFVSAMYQAMPILKKIVKSNSELDLILSLHTFPQKIQYVNPCPECKGNGRTPDGMVCSACEGTMIDKKDIHKSSQDVLYVPRPRDKEEQMDLSKMVHYVEYDVDLFNAVDRFVDKNIRRCKEAVYNSEVFSRGEVQETAYQRNIELQNVYDALWPMAQAYAYTYNFFMNVITKVTELDGDLIHNLRFRKDFKMKGLTDLYQDLKWVADSKADEFVKRGIEDDIASILYEDNQRELLKYHTVNYFFPFSGKNKDEIKIVMASPYTPKKVKVLWANFSFIFDELEMEQGKKKVDFYRMPREEQHRLLNEKVDAIIEATEQEGGEIRLPSEEDIDE